MEQQKRLENWNGGIFKRAQLELQFIRVTFSPPRFFKLHSPIHDRGAHVFFISMPETRPSSCSFSVSLSISLSTSIERRVSRPCLLSVICTKTRFCLSPGAGTILYPVFL